jgi:hypothetical protein
MKTKSIIFIIVITITSLISCTQKEKTDSTKIIFLHHSTGGVIWQGNTTSAIVRLAGKVSGRLAAMLKPKAELPTLFKKYNRKGVRNYTIKERAFPKETPYGWNNNPFDYYNIWVKNAGEVPFKEEPTLEMLTKEYQVIIFKHCFPVCNIMEDQDTANINSDLKTISNYKLQYSALRKKLHEFPNTKFILFTGAAQIRFNITEDEAKRAQVFFKWVVDEWDIANDNIYLWDLYKLQTEGDLYFKNDYAISSKNSHPNQVFADKLARLLFCRLVDIIENDGNGTLLTGEKKIN